jgi:hypothetical protein
VRVVGLNTIGGLRVEGVVARKKEPDLWARRLGRGAMRRLGFGEEQGALRRFGSLGRAKWAGVTRVARGWPGEREGEEGGRAGPRNGPREAGPAKTIGEAKPFFYFLPFYSFLYS